MLIIAIRLGTEDAKQITAYDLDKAISEIADGGLLDARYTKILRKIFIWLELDTHRHLDVAVNEPYRPGRLNIYVIDESKVADNIDCSPLIAGQRDQNGSLLARRLLSCAKNNFIAIRPNIITIDSSFFAAIALNAFNDRLSFMQALDLASRQNSVERVGGISSSFGFLDTRLRIANIRNANNHTQSDREPVTLVPMMLEVTDEFNVDDLLYFSVLPILAHEMGHLRKDSSGGFNLSDVMKTIDARATLVEENAADGYAFDLVRDTLAARAGRTHFDHNLISKDFESELDQESAISLVKYLRELVLERTFANFRGLDAEDVVVRLGHLDCRDPKARDIGIEPEFGRIDFVISGDLDRLPFLTDGEFTTLKDSFMASVATKTHAHHLLRARRLLESIASVSDAELATPFPPLSGVMFDRYERLFRAYSGEVPPDTVSDVGRTEFDISKEEALNFVKDEFRFEPAATCPRSRCEVGYFSDGSGYVEISSLPSGKLTDFRLVLHLLPISQPGETAVMQRALLLRLIMNLGKTEAEGAQAMLMDALDELAKCGYIDLTYGAENYGVTIRSLNGSNWFSLELTAL